ncbi:MAG: class I SAM-dependent methyltransferase [Acidobacteriia bacterium]|nr:class I SAM-dependent methyltransferase [Terriglobia bacterium]
MTVPAGGYDPSFYELLYAAEDQHFWFRSRNAVIAAMVSQAVAGLAPGYRVLELGCGNGNVTRLLQATCSEGLVIGMDLFGEGLRNARRRGVTQLVQADVNRAPFQKKFQVIGMFDVLEHIPDDGRSCVKHSISWTLGVHSFLLCPHTRNSGATSTKLPSTAGDTHSPI